MLPTSKPLPDNRGETANRRTDITMFDRSHDHQSRQLSVDPIDYQVLKSESPACSETEENIVQNNVALEKAVKNSSDLHTPLRRSVRNIRKPQRLDL